MNECLCPVIKNSAGPREQMRLLCYIQLKVHWNIYNAKTMYTALVTSMRREVPTACTNQWHKRMFISSLFSLAQSGNGTFCQPQSLMQTN